ncbi:hypothetical protein K3495_g11073 [Podosphaera aphanis]|nr:hypothetical protein K3495_g11073 [Podosphaera aphanis]
MSVTQLQEKAVRSGSSTPSSPSFSYDLATYQRLNRSIWYYVPEKQPAVPNGAPSVILLAGWMAATPRHISKYTAGYRALYPHARIIAITTTPWDMIPIDTISGGVARIQPVLDILYGLDPQEKVLLQLMSNGGVMTSCFIARTFKKQTGRMLPVSAIVMDSAPGKATWDASVRAFSVVLPKNPIINFLGHLLIYVLFGIYCALHKLFNVLDDVAQGRIDLNDPEIFHMDIPRLYIYSEADCIVDWKDVEEHAGEAADLGVEATYEKFNESVHAGHLMLDAQRYWVAVQDLWNRVHS